MMMLTAEELEQLMSDPAGQIFAQQLMSVGVDPIVGFSFSKDLMSQVNKIKFELEKQYSIDADVIMKIEVHGPRGARPSNET